MKSLPIVALIGQTNAGKSSLLNRLARQKIAIVAREEGTTRDNVMARIDDRFLLVDTAGLKNPDDDFEANIQDQIQDAIDSAEIILLTVDSTKYPSQRDRDIAKSALKSRKPVLLLLNKSDRGESLPNNEFLRLGVKSNMTFRTSATTGQGIKELKKEIEKQLPSRVQTGVSLSSQGASPSSPHRSSPIAEPLSGNVSSISPLKIALIGRPNVGKSSLFNSLGKKQQAIVSSRQGTTRDVNRVNLKYKGRDLEILDTAGLRKPGTREVGIEKFSALRSLAAIEEADICALLVDATEPHSKLDQSLAGQIVKAGKGIIVVITKTDLYKESNGPAETVPRNHHEDFEVSDPRNDGLSRMGSKQDPFDSLLSALEYDFNFIPYAPVLLTSSETGKNVTQLFELALQIDDDRHIQVKTSELNKILGDAIISHPPAGLKNTHPKPKYMVQTDTCPPWFVVHGHELQLMHWSYKRFLERKIREKYPFIGTPIFFSFYND